MNWVQLLLQILPFVFRLIPIAEKAFADVPKSGAEKKAMVMGATSVAVDALATISTGGQKETWDRIAKPVSGIVDAACTIMFPQDTSHIPGG